jgi:hypothetical protein
MHLGEDRRTALFSSARELVQTLNVICAEARERLACSGDVDPRNVLAAPSSSMTNGASRAAATIRSAVARDRDSLARLAREPFIAKVRVVSDKGGETVLYVSRGGVSALTPPPGIRLVSYGAPLGRLAELTPGSDCSLPSTGGVSQSGTVSERVRLAPVASGGVWDAKDASFEWEEWNVFLASLAQLLEREGVERDSDSEVPDLLGDLLQQHVDSQLLRASARRRHIESISLRDQPILDVEQGNIFRLPLARKVWLVGPPGTGKTTTLIRRLSQKRTAETLSEEEVGLLQQHALGDAHFGPEGWMMFAPTDLLKLYLRDAFNREGVAATDANLKTWAKHRVHLGRNVFGILRSAERRGLQLEPDARVLARTDSSAGVALYERFRADFTEHFLTHLAHAFEVIKDSGTAELWTRVSRLQPPGASQATVSDRLSRIVDQSEDLLPTLKAMDEELDTQTRRVVNVMLRQNAGILEELESAVALWQEDSSDDTSDEDEDETDSPGDARTTTQPTRGAAAAFLLQAIRAYARALARGRSTVGGRAGKIVALLGARVPTKDALASVGQLLTIRQALRSVTQAPRRFVMSAPAAYAHFRRVHAGDPSLYSAGAEGYIKAGRISGPELDALILLMLRHARLVLQPRGIRTTLRPAAADEEWMETIRAEYVCQVFVDEATDFSAVQLGCLTELAHPGLRSWFACGDFMQRITAEGISGESDVEWLNTLDGDPVTTQQLSTGYRQSQRLRELVQAFSSSIDATAVTIAPPSFDHTDTAAALLREHAAGEALADWLSARIAEIERRLGVLPSIAIFVDGDEMIDPLVETLRPRLAEHNIAVVGCKEGRVVGDEQEVRVFDVRFIKGLEFEAVFFIGVDGLVQSLGPSFERLFLVGASRAATYLAVTAEGELPNVVSAVRAHFEEGSWQ